MKLREFAIWLLLRIYPAAWRREFGAEFEELLQHFPVSLPVLVNVRIGALGERVIDLSRRMSGGSEMADRAFGARYDRLTKIVSGAVVALLVVGLVMAMRSRAVTALVVFLPTVVFALSFAFLAAWI